VDAERAKSYFTAGDDDRRYGGIMRDIPKLVGRAPYEDLVAGLLMRSSKLPTLHKLELQQQQDITMDMLADIKMVHEFLNTFGTPLGLTKDSGEWITFGMYLGKGVSLFFVYRKYDSFHGPPGLMVYNMLTFSFRFTTLHDQEPKSGQPAAGSQLQNGPGGLR